MSDECEEVRKIIKLEGEAKEFAALVLAIQERQGCAGEILHSVHPPVNIFNGQHRSGGGGTGYDASIDGRLEIKDFGRAIETLANIESAICGLCAALKNSGAGITSK